MKLIKQTIALAVCCLLVACTSENNFPSEEESADNFDVTVGVSTPSGISSKSIGEEDNVDETNKVKLVQIYVFRESGDLDAFATGQIGDDIKLKVTKGNREFFAVANPQAEFSQITKKDVFLKAVSKLENESLGSFSMIGTAGSKLIENATDIKITVARLVSRVQLQYDVDFTGTAWEGKKFTADSIYIMNANSRVTANAALDNEVATDLVSGGWNQLINLNLLDVNDGTWAEAPAPRNGSKWFSYYIYKNDKPTPETVYGFTSLVIAGRIEGSTDKTYYRIDINSPKSTVSGDPGYLKNYIKNNTIYRIKALIKGQGTITPPEEPINIHVLVNVQPWNSVDQEVEF